MDREIHPSFFKLCGGGARIGVAGLRPIAHQDDGGPFPSSDCSSLAAARTLR
jgi:hypothetical protein